MFKEYSLLFYYFMICFFLVMLLLCLSIFFVKQKPDVEKLSAYECGFNPYEDARMRFEIRFFFGGSFVYCF